MSQKAKDARTAALDTIAKLRRAGYLALLAGGCVRDMLLGVEPKDYDVATDAPPDRVKVLFPRARQVGAKFGVVLVRKYGYDVEVATFRTDGTYTNGRRPDEITFGTAAEDAQRRDFTINGMFLDPVEDRLIDYVGGQEDLQAGILRTIGQPDQRFAEDHLRMLRAIRFAARLGFAIEPETMAAIGRLAEKLTAISTERIWIELEQILTAPTRGAGWALLLASGLRPYLAPGWTWDKSEDAGVLARLEKLPANSIDPSLAMAAVLHARAPKEVNRICRELKLSNQQRLAVVWLVRSLPAARRPDALELADLKFLMADRGWSNLTELLLVDELARTGQPKAYEEVRRMAAAIDPEEVAPAPLLTGDDLLEIGAARGPKFGRILKQVYRAQLNGEVTTAGEALALARSLMAESKPR